MADQSEAARGRVHFSSTLSGLHEGLLVTTLLQHPSAADVLRGPAFVSHKSAHTWHRFLDELCQLCQFDKGASNTTSIAVAEAEVNGGPANFWLATNTGSKLELEGSRNRRRGHLLLILNALKRAGSSEDWEKEREESKALELIFCRSVGFSIEKISNYQKGLRRFCVQIIDQLKRRGTCSAEDKSLLNSLERLTSEKDPPKLCVLAYTFPVYSSTDYDTLKAKINQTTQGTWKEIRHCIGRLASLRRAAVFVASKADWFSKELQSFQVSCVEVEPTTHEVEFEARNEFRSILQRVCPRLSERGLLDLTAEKMQRATGVIGKLTGLAKETVVHAEAAMAHHFYMNNLKFLGDDRYIGCSKPSCYGCTLYLSEHPGLFLSRQTSDNAYFKWAPPLGKNEDLSVDGATMRTLRSMMSRIDTDILSNAENRSFTARPQFDSTTGRTLTAGHAITVVE